MSKRSRRPTRPPGRQNPPPSLRRAQPPSRRLPLRWLLVGGGAAAALVSVVVAITIAGTSQGLPGVQTSQPPWQPETANLRARLQAIGLAALTAEGETQHTHQHLDLYVDGQWVPIPSDIGINRPAGFLAPIHTHDRSGIIHVESPVVRDFTLGEFFDVWGVRFDGHCVGGACEGNGRTLSLFLDGKPFAGDSRSLVLTAHEEIVVALGTVAQLPNPVPASYAFPPGL